MAISNPNDHNLFPLQALNLSSIILKACFPETNQLSCSKFLIIVTNNGHLLASHPPTFLSENFSAPFFQDGGDTHQKINEICVVYGVEARLKNESRSIFHPNL